MGRWLGAACAAALLRGVGAQLPGSEQQEDHPAMQMYKCSSEGCCKDDAMITVDANWRWLHAKGKYDNCFEGDWVHTYCPSQGVCATNCVLEGLDPALYKSQYGITTEGNAVRLQFLTKNSYGLNVGSRVYAMQGNEYKMYFLKNREITFDVDLSTLKCGINGALYFVEMASNGDLGVGKNKAGAHFGTGYCDAQCFLDGKFMGGTANVPLGKSGYCCTEVDIWEANTHSTAFSMHTCEDPGAKMCSGLECGPGQNGDSSRSKGRCDRDGCDWNDWRLGNKTFFGQGAHYQIDSTKPMTITTQFVTSDGTDEGDLVEIRRSYKQHGRTIKMPSPTLVDESASSMTDDFCEKQKTAFGDPPDFQDRGGMKALGDALDRGMVLVMSIWDDTEVYMDWLDSTYPKKSKDVGAERGNCPPEESKPANVRKSNPHAFVEYSNIRVGKIGTTQGAVGGVCPQPPINVYKPSVGALSADTKYKSTPKTHKASAVQFYHALTGINVRKKPDVGSDKTGAVVSKGDVFEVTEVVQGDGGQRYLKLKNQDGWVFAQGVGGKWLGKPVVEASAVQFYHALTGINVRKKPDVGSDKTGAVVSEGDVFEVTEVVQGDGGQRYLKLKNQDGWVFAQGVGGKWLGKPVVELHKSTDKSHKSKSDKAKRSMSDSEPKLLSSKIDARIAAYKGTTVFGGLSATVLCAVVASGLLAAAVARWCRAPSQGIPRLIAVDPASSDASGSF